MPAPPGVNTPHFGGLTQAEAAARLARDGPNDLPTAERRHVLKLLLALMREPMLLLLMASAGLYLVLGDAEEALALLAAVVLVVGITLYQERKTERALDALRELSSPRALVIRDGVARRIPGREVVSGDVIALAEGERVPADAVLVSSTNLIADESLLTGESVPVRKIAALGAVPAEPPGGDDRPFIWSGTLVSSGTGMAHVTATGPRTQLGTIGSSLASIETGASTGLQREVGRAVRLLAIVGLSACVALAIGYGIKRHDWIEGILAGLTVAISMVPEEFPVVLTIFLALGAWRIAKHQVLTRHLPAIETLGSTTVLCVDKTGTLTCNQMTVAEIRGGADRWTIGAGVERWPPPCLRVLEVAADACTPDAFDPMDRAVTALRDRASPRSQTSDGRVLAREYSLSDRLFAVTNAWRVDAAALDVATKGAPEAVMALCAVDDSRRAGILAGVDDMARRGLRVLAVGHARWHDATLPDTPDRFPFHFLGLIGFTDPLRPGVAAAIEECRGAGIRVVMMTGDYPSTAAAIARQIGIADADVFARVTPMQKLDLVRRFSGDGEVVAMTGDGVNDGPALKAADIGIAMGTRGTDVAREAADLVLLDDDFSSLVRAVRLGRRIYDNIRKASGYILAVHVPVAGVALLPLFVDAPLILMPVHIIFLEMLIDPACSIGFEMEPGEPDLMRRPPRPAGQRLITGRLAALSLLQGGGALAGTVAAFAIGVWSSFDEAALRTVTFSSLIVVNLALIVSTRAQDRPFWRALRGRNPMLAWLPMGALCALAAVLAVPILREVFRLSLPGPFEIGIVAIAAAGGLLWMEAVKLWWSRRS